MWPNGDYPTNMAHLCTLSWIIWAISRASIFWCAGYRIRGPSELGTASAGNRTRIITRSAMSAYGLILENNQHGFKHCTLSGRVGPAPTDKWWLMVNKNTWEIVCILGLPCQKQQQKQIEHNIINAVSCLGGRGEGVCADRKKYGNGLVYSQVSIPRRSVPYLGAYETRQASSSIRHAARGAASRRSVRHETELTRISNMHWNMFQNINLRRFVLKHVVCIWVTFDCHNMICTIGIIYWGCTNPGNHPCIFVNAAMSAVSRISVRHEPELARIPNINAYTFFPTWIQNRRRGIPIIIICSNWWGIAHQRTPLPWRVGAVSGYSTLLLSENPTATLVPQNDQGWLNCVAIYSGCDSRWKTSSDRVCMKAEMLR